MQRINRIYVSHFGTPTAWYDHHVFDLSDPETAEPTDVTFNLENAGGKTTLLSYIFSCFEPKLDRWLQHLQQKNHRFHEYFARDGRPSFILLEWQMPARSPGAPDYRLIVGQAVTIKDSIERSADVERWFFAFETVPGLGLGEFPGHGLSLAPVRSMTEFVAWMHQAEKLSGGDFFRSKTQDDWVKHLGGTRLLDIELLRMQVDFNSSEGGMEEGFLTFNSEADLVRRFLTLTLDPEKSAAVRDGIAKTADKLKSRPRYEKQLAELTKLHTVMIPFADAAATYESARLEHRETHRHATGLAAALRRGHQEAASAAAGKRAYAGVQDGVAKTATATAQLHRSDIIALQGLQLDRRFLTARGRRDEAKNALAMGLRRVRLLNGAQARAHCEAMKYELSELEGLIEAAVEGLKPARAQAEVQGALLDFALETAQAVVGTRIEEAAVVERRSDGLVQALAAEAKDAQRKLQSFAAERGELQGFVRLHDDQRLRLIKDGLLTPKDTSTSDAIERLHALIEELNAQEQQLAEQIVELAEQEQVSRNQASAQDVSLARANAAQQPLRTFLSAGEVLRDRLAQAGVLRLAADADLADPDSTSLVGELDALVDDAEREISERNVRLSQLSADQASIVETGLAGRSADVDEVVKQLRNAGIRSARAANTYIADLQTDAVEARLLVMSDPARFLGVMVAEGDWEKLGQKLPSLQTSLASPVTVAVTSLVAQNSAVDRVVLEPAEASAFNKDAAQDALKVLDARIAAVSKDLRDYRERRQEGIAIRGELLRYQDEYGAARLRQAELNIADLVAEEEVARARKAELLAAADLSKRQRSGLEEQKKPLPQRVQTGIGARGRLEEFLRTYENPAEGKRLRLEELSTFIDDINGRIELLAGQRVDADGRKVRAIEDRLRHKGESDAIGKERNDIAYVDRDYPAGEQLKANARPLEALRSSYGDAVAMLLAGEREQVGVLTDRREQKRIAKTSADEAFKEFSDLPIGELKALVDLDFKTEFREQELANQRLGTLNEETSAVHTAAETEVAIFWKGVKQRPVVTPEMQARSDEALAVSIVQADADAARLEASAENAQTEAATAKSSAAESDVLSDRLNGLQSSLAAAIINLADDYDAMLLPPEPEPYTNDLIRRFGEQKLRLDGYKDGASRTFRAVTACVRSKDLIEVEAELAREIADSDFDLACSDRGRVIDLINDRIAAARDTLDGMEPDFQNSVGELYNLTYEAISLLNRACHKTMPAAAPYVGGKPILRMRAKFSGIPVEARKAAIRTYFNSLIAAGLIPAKGADLVTHSLVAISGRSDLGIELLKMEQNIAHQYQLASELKSSRGQGTVIAMFLYLLISQLRSDTQTTVKRGGGGPLILDNPFAKVQTRALIDAQRLLAKEIGVQLIFFTANADYNILAGFRRVIRLRKSHVNSKSQRSHIEVASATFEDLTVSEALQ